MQVPEAESGFWDLVHKLVALGAVDETIDLLGYHSVWSTSYRSQQQDPNLAAQVIGLWRAASGYHPDVFVVRLLREIVAKPARS